MRLRTQWPYNLSYYSYLLIENLELIIFTSLNPIKIFSEYYVALLSTKIHFSTFPNDVWNVIVF